MADTAANPAGGAFGALNGLKVIDLTRVLGGPYGTQILGDHGAEIVKIEPPQGDEVRDWGPPFLEGDASYFIGVNRNKRSLGLDLSKPEGREVLLRLLDGADVLMDMPAARFSRTQTNVAESTRPIVYGEKKAS